MEVFTMVKKGRRKRVSNDVMYMRQIGPVDCEGNPIDDTEEQLKQQEATCLIFCYVCKKLKKEKVGIKTYMRGKLHLNLKCESCRFNSNDWHLKNYDAILDLELEGRSTETNNQLKKKIANILNERGIDDLEKEIEMRKDPRRKKLNTQGMEIKFS